LYVNFRPFGIEVVLRYKPWKAYGLATHRLDFESRVWIADFDDPGIILVDCPEEDATNPEDPLRLFTACIPRQIRVRVSPFSHLQTPLLQALARSDKALQLFEHTPVLLWLLLDRNLSLVRRVEILDRVLSLKMTDILDLIFRRDYRDIQGGFQKAHVKFLRKIRLHSGNLEELNTVKQAVQNDFLVDRLRHWSWIPVQSLDLWQYCMKEDFFDDMADSPLLNQPMDQAYQYKYEIAAFAHSLSCTWGDIVRMGEHLQIGNIRRILKNCADHGELHRIHDELTHRVNERASRARQELETTPFPEPPLPGNEAIQPIRTYQELRAEGQTMSHCVLSYARAVREGRSYIYQVLSPERGTLEIARTGKKLHIQQFRLTGNGHPSDESWEYVRGWFAGFQKKVTGQV
jgi:hypothetical protein